MYLIPLDRGHQSNTAKQSGVCLPFRYHVKNDIRLVNAAIVHDNDRIGARVWIHLVQQTIDKPSEFDSGKGAFNDINSKYTIE